MEQIKLNGLNEIPPPRELPWWAKLLLCFTTGFSPLLWVSSVILIISWQPFCPTCLSNLIEAILLISIIISTGLFSYYQESQTGEILKAFESMLANDATVKRDGVIQTIPTSQLTVGDIVLLNSGQRVPADIRILEASNLYVDKSILNGESEPVKIFSQEITDENISMLEAKNMTFMGSTIVEGEGRGVVVAIGRDTQLAHIAQSVSVLQEKMSTLQMEIHHFVIRISFIAITWVLVVVFIWIFYLNVYHPEFMSTFSMIANAIGVLVALVPQGLPLSLNLGLSFASKYLFKLQVMVKKMSTIETFGCMSFLASDKTGTLTQNKMTVHSLLFADGYKLSVDDSMKNTSTIPKCLLETAIFCNQSKLNIHTKEVIGGNGIDKALMNWVMGQSSVFIDNITKSSKIVMTIPFSSTTKFAVVVIETNGIFQVLMKGAPEYVAKRCTSYYSFQEEKVIGIENDSQISIFSNNLKEIVDSVSLEGQRVIGIATLTLKPTEVPIEFVSEPVPNFPLQGLTFISAVSVSDPPKLNVDLAISELRHAGIQVAMVTGDAVTTAEAIAKQVGIITTTDITHFNGCIESPKSENVCDNDIENTIPSIATTINSSSLVKSAKDSIHLRAIVVEGQYIDGMTDDMWDYILSFDEFVFARTTPEHKLKIVSKQQKRNRIVGVTGDGTNDAPALKRANIGVAMYSGSRVASDAAAVILLNDNFNTIPTCVEQGRLLFTNLQNAIAYMISAGCWAELLPVLATFILGIPTPLSSLMMIVICLMSDTAAGIALMCEAPEKSLMNESPRKISNHLVSWKLIAYSYLFMGNIQSIAAFYNYFTYMSERGPIAAPDPLPIDDAINQPYSSLGFPIGYTPSQLVGAWTWATGTGSLSADQISAAATGSSVFYTTLVVCQIGHLISIRRRTPYFSAAILNTNHSTDSLFIRLYKELLDSRPPLPIVYAVLFALCTANFWNEVPVIQESIGTGSVSGRYWGIAIGFSFICFLASEIRKWLIILLPQKYANALLF